LSFFTITTLFIVTLNASVFGQILYDSFSDGNFTINPVFSGTDANWTVVADSDVAAGAIGSNTVRLNVLTAVAGTDYLSSQISNFGSTQQWGIFIGRRGQAFTTANQQYFWLYANEANLTSATVDGYRLAIGDNAGDDNIRLEYIVNGALSATVITSSGTIPNGLTDIGFLVRVTRSSTGGFGLFTSALPTASGSGAIATDIPNAANASISQGTGTENSLIPAANGYIGLAALHSTDVAARAAAEFDQVSFSPFGPTAASAVIGGRITTTRGRGISYVTIMLSGGNLEDPIYATTGTFGYYQFPELATGETYILQVFSRRFTFEPSSRVVNLNNNFTDADFVGAEAWSTTRVR